MYVRRYGQTGERTFETGLIMSTLSKSQPKKKVYKQKNSKQQQQHIHKKRNYSENESRNKNQNKHHINAHQD